MYCKNCGKAVEEGSLYCNNCGTFLNNTKNQNGFDDNASFGFAILGFFIPIAGLILFLVYEDKKPKRAKSAGKGALIGFITKVVLLVILYILYILFAASLISNTVSLISNMLNETESNIPVIGSFFEEETIDQILGKYVEVSFGEFKVTSNGYFSETSLDVNVKNIAEKRYSYYMIIEAIDENGTRIGTDTIYADKLNAGQDINLTAFEYVKEDRITQFKNARFRVLEIEKYDF